MDSITHLKTTTYGSFDACSCSYSNFSFDAGHHEVRSILIILQSFFAAGFGLVEDVDVVLAASVKVARR